jgi:hypothetical protein
MVQQTQSICHDCRGEGEKIRGGFNVIYYNPQVGFLSSGSSAQKFSTHEKFLPTENFPKISLLKVENFQLFSDGKFVSANHILQIFLSAENFPVWKWTFSSIEQDAQGQSQSKSNASLLQSICFVKRFDYECSLFKDIGNKKLV